MLTHVVLYGLFLYYDMFFYMDFYGAYPMHFLHLKKGILRE